MATTEKAAPTKSKKRGGCRATLISLGVMFGLLLVAVAVLVGLGLIRANQDKATYIQARTALLDADCETALEKYEEVKHPYNLFFSSAAPALDEEMPACEAYLNLQEVEDPEILVLQSRNFMERPPVGEGVLTDRVREQAQAVFEETAVEEIAGEDFCEDADTFLGSGLLPEPEVEYAVPLLLACAEIAENDAAATRLMSDLVEEYADSEQADLIVERTLEDYPCQSLAIEAMAEALDRPELVPMGLFLCAGEWPLKTAIEKYEQLQLDYPDFEPEMVEAALAQAMVAYATELKVGRIEQPLVVSFSEDSTAHVIILNSSPGDLRLVFTGPENRIEDLGACPTCERVSNIEEAICSDDAPVGEYDLEPGIYEMLVQVTSEGNVNPFTGDWLLEAGVVYADCFHIVRPSP